ncbi:circadian clock-controlled protein daywake-like [Drosophila albomicans]|uniref:Circadian clock-controlled protein daywake-like n=1 Tax=Drosophila albomicans TaxID=7291 RepID=A0A6P8X3Z0_DROAB|nr:circadian clock-controlled protein daywake-like [Drosophila albomicans]
MSFIKYSLNFLLLATLCKAFPEEVQKCHFGDEKCLVDSMNYVIKHYRKGIPEIGVKPIDVVDIADLNLVGHAITSTWININLTNQINYGFENTTITSVQGFNKDPTATHLNISGHIPVLIHKGFFKAVGQIYLVKANLSGISLSEFQNLKFTLKLKSIIEFRNNKRYLKIYELTPIVKISRWVIWMEDLFTENSDMTIIVNRIFNDNWLEIWNEWEPTILNSFSGVFLGLIKDVFDKVSYDDLFLPDSEDKLT